MSTVQNPYGFHFKRPEFNEEEEDEYGENSCPDGCCDHDCECDDCLRCANNSLEEPEDFEDAAAA